MSTSEPFDIAIVGGGIAGLTLAIGLLKHNIPITIYESAHHFGEIGAGVAFGPNATGAMRLIDPRIKAAFDHVAATNQWESKRHVWFECRYGQDLPATHPEGPKKTGDLLGAITCPNGQATCHRAAFLDEMIKLIPSDVAHFGKRLLSIEELTGLASQGVRLHFRDGTAATHAAVVGCDGIKSVTRLHVLGSSAPAAHAQWTGKYCYRCLVPMEDAVAVIGEELALNNQVYLGPHGHLLTFPVQKGKTLNIVAYSSQEQWKHEDWVIHATKEDLRRDFQGYGTILQAILPLIQKIDIWALFDDPPADTYCKGRVCIMGDAAHASTPFQGSGAGMAIEDAYVLSSLLDNTARSDEVDTTNRTDGPERAFKAFDAVRRERTQRLVRTSREAGHLFQFELEGVGDDYEKLRDNMMKRMQWVWSENLEEEVKEGRKIMTGV